MYEPAAIIGLVVAAVILLNFLASAITFFIPSADNLGDAPIGWFVVSGIVLLVTVIVCAFSYFPYDAKYFKWEVKEGVIAETAFDSKADTSYKGDSSRGGIRVMLGDGTTFYTQDFRVATKKVGEKVLLVCKPSYQSGNVDRLDCKAQIGYM